MTVEHYEEVEAPHGADPLDVDWPKYLMLERVGIYRAILAKLSGKLIGYAAYFVQPPLHHRSNVWAVNDVLFVDPAYRQSTLGAALIYESERLLKEVGAGLVVQEDRKPAHSTKAKPSATLGDLLIRRGYSRVGAIYAKRL